MRGSRGLLYRAAVLVLALACAWGLPGCNSLSRASPSPLKGLHLPREASQTGSAAFKNQVETDPFPRAGRSGT